jgi:hypothetical protein
MKKGDVMKRSTAVCAVTAFAVLAFSGSLFAIDADEIVRRHLEAKGGIEKLKSMKSLYMKGKVITGDMAGEVEVAKRAPHFHFQAIRTPRGSWTEGYDGENMWNTNPRTGFHMIDDENRERYLIKTVMEPLLNFEESGGRYEYVGTADVRGDSCYKLLFVQSTGDSTYSLFSMDTYLQVKTEVNTPGGLAEQFFEDFRRVDGYMFPFVVMIGTSRGKRTITYDTIAVNQPVSDSFFVMPDPTTVPSIAKPLPDSARGRVPERE